MKTGWQSIPEHEYQYGEKYRFCLRKSGIVAFEEGPDVFLYSKTNPKPPTKDQQFYSAIHSILTASYADIIVLEWDNYRKKDARREYDEALEAHPCRPIILRHQMDQVEEIANSVMAHPVAERVLSQPDNVYEQAGVFKIYDILDAKDLSRTQIYGMIKPDIRIPSKRLIVDLKAMGKATLQQFLIQCRKGKWDYQEYWYRYGADIIDECESDDGYSFAFLCYMTEAPYRCEIFYSEDFGYHDEAYVKMQARVDKIVADFAYCVDTGDWSQDYSNKPFSVPKRY